MSCCLQCKRMVSGPSNRLVQDSCGHKKCRFCLLDDEVDCKQCFVPQKGGVIKLNGDLDNSRKPRSKAIKIPGHIKVCLEPLSYHCDICDKTFTTKSHVKYHTYCDGIKPHKCLLCNKEFVLKAQLNVHLMKHSGSQPHECAVCSKKFSEKSKLTRHKKIHSGAVGFVCNSCGKAFKTKESLRIHSLTHQKNKPFSCSLCTRTFSNGSNFKKHLVSHSNELNYMCDQCGKRFKLKWALSVHRKSHSRLRPFECNLCTKSFTTHKDLQRHSLIHIDMKGFACSLCKTSFRRKDNLSRHMKNTHPNKKGEIILDQPNACKVITSPPAFTRKLESASSNKHERLESVINGPIKLAFKPPAFRNNYNLNRSLSEEDVQPPIHYETSFQNRQHALIKNIKFKVPIQYTTKSFGGKEDQITTVENNNTYIELKPVSSNSVIVNAQPSSMHWRRRTLQNLNLKS